MTNAQTVANQFGGFEPPSAEIQAEIDRLSRQPYLELDRVKNCHSWMYELLMSRSTGILVGASRCGKTVTCKSFAERYNKYKSGKGRRIKPVVYIQIPVSCGSRDFFIKILKVLNKPTNGSVSDLRERTLDGLAIHQVEMLIVDEQIRELVHNGHGEQAIEKYIRQSTPSIRGDGCKKVLLGYTSLEEVLRVTREE